MVDSLENKLKKEDKRNTPKGIFHDLVNTGVKIYSILYGILHPIEYFTGKGGFAENDDYAEIPRTNFLGGQYSNAKENTTYYVGKGVKVKDAKVSLAVRDQDVDFDISTKDGFGFHLKGSQFSYKVTDAKKFYWQGEQNLGKIIERFTSEFKREAISQKLEYFIEDKDKSVSDKIQEIKEKVLKRINSGAVNIEDTFGINILNFSPNIRFNDYTSKVLAQEREAKEKAKAIQILAEAETMQQTRQAMGPIRAYNVLYDGFKGLFEEKGIKLSPEELKKEVDKHNLLQRLFEYFQFFERKPGAE